MELWQPHVRQVQELQQLRQQPQRRHVQPHEVEALLSDTPATEPDEQPQELEEFPLVLPATEPEDWQQGLQQELATKFGNTMPPQTV